MTADKHLNLDLKFLDEKSSGAKKTSSSGNIKTAITGLNGPNIKWWKVITALGVPALIFLAISIAVQDESSKSPKKPAVMPAENNETPSTDNFRCSSYHQNRVNDLRPNSLDDASLTTEHNRLEARSKTISTLAETIDNTKVNQYSQASLDNYNALVNRHNTLLKSYRRDFAIFQSKIDQYDRAIKTYNTYLETNCERVK